MYHSPASAFSPGLLNAIKKADIFSSLDKASLDEIVPELETHSLSTGEVLVGQGELGNRLYLLVFGRLHLVRQNEDNEVVTPGQVIGAVTLITGEIYSYTVQAVEPCMLVSLSKKGLSRVAARSPAAEDQLVNQIQRNFYTAQLNRLLEASNSFGDLDPVVMKDLQAEFTFESLKGGQVFMQQGDPSDSLYLVISGRLGVFIHTSSGEKNILIELGRGQTVGEMGLIMHEPRSASVYAMRDSLLARLSRESFERLLARYPKDIMEHFAGASIQRLTNQIQGKIPPSKTAVSIAILPAQQGLPVHEFAARLAQAMQQLGPTLLITSQVCDDRLCREGMAQISVEDPGNSRLVLWLSEQEAAYQFVIYAGDAFYNQWTHRCWRQADHILLLCKPSEQHFEMLNLPESDRTLASLVLLYEDDTSHPVGTQAALDLYGLKDQFKVRANRGSDYSRLARLLAGKGTGLVLSGGGARALAQIGVLRALIEAGYEFDAVAGVSAGAIIAALFAMGLTTEEIIRKIRDQVKRVDYTFPFHSLVSGKIWTAGLQKVMADWQIEDLWIEFFCISANLTRSNMHIHRSGLLFQAVRASTSIPGILPPVAYDGDILVDGGLINNFPVDRMRLNPRIGTVIGIDVAQVRERSSPASFGYSVSGWQSLLARFLPFVPKPEVPNILEILSESMMLSKTQSESSNRSLVDLYLCPPTNGINLMDFKKVEEIAEAGYQYGRMAIAQQQGF